MARSVIKVSEDPEINITSEYFYGISDALEQLVQEVRQKLTQEVRVWSLIFDVTEAPVLYMVCAYSHDVIPLI